MWSAYWKCVWETNGNLYVIKIKFTEWNLRAPSWLQCKYLSKDENDVFLGMHRSIWYAQYLFFWVWNMKQRWWYGHEFIIGQENSIFIINKYVMAFSWIVELIKSPLFTLKLSVMIVPYFVCVVSFYFICITGSNYVSDWPSPVIHDFRWMLDIKHHFLSSKWRKKVIAFWRLLKKIARCK